MINLSQPTKPTESTGQVNQSNTHIAASQSTLKGGSDAGAARTGAAVAQPAVQAAPVEEEVARIRLKISAKATYSK